MRVLLDECVPRTVKSWFANSNHLCQTARDVGLGGKSNGELLALADGQFDVLITVDKNIRHQQNLKGRTLAILVLRVPSNDISDIEPLIPAALAALKSIQAGQLVEIEAE